MSGFSNKFVYCMEKHLGHQIALSHALVVYVFVLNLIAFKRPFVMDHELLTASVNSKTLWPWVGKFAVSSASYHSCTVSPQVRPCTNSTGCEFVRNLLPSI